MKEMYLLFLVIIFFISACNTYLPSSALDSRPATSLTDLPLKPHARDIQVYFGMEKPSEPYYKVKLVEIGAGTNTSLDAMLVQLKHKAQVEGLDALMVSEISRQGSTMTNGEIEWKQFTAIGIKYKRTIDYMDTILRHLEISWWNDDNAEPKQFRIHYDMHGHVLSLGDPFVHKFYSDQLYPYEALGTGFGPIEGWDYKLDSNGYLLSKRRTGTDIIVMKCNYYYKHGLLEKAEIMIPAATDGSRVRQRFLVLPEYASNGALTGRQLWNGKTLIWTDRIYYRLNGMPDRLIRYTLKQDNQEKMLEIRFNYYTAEDLPKAEG